MKNSLRVLTLVFALGCALTARGADNTHEINGTWKPVQAELGAQPMPAAVLTTIILKMDGTNYEVTVDTPKGKSVDKGTVKFDPTTKPKGMTVLGVSGPNAGKSFPAIYELNGDKLRICYDLSGAKRPAQFKSLASTKLYLVTYERTKL